MGCAQSSPPPYSAPPIETNVRRLSRHIRSRASGVTVRYSLAAALRATPKELPDDLATVRTLARQALALATACGEDVRLELAGGGSRVRARLGADIIEL